MNFIGRIKLADFNFGLFSKSALPILLEEGFEHFFHENLTTNDRFINIHDFLIDLPSLAKLIYEAKQENNVLWKVYEVDDAIIMEVFNPITFEIQQRATYSSKKKTWDIYCLPFTTGENETVINPLAYPMAPLVWYYLSTEEDIIMIHASGIDDHGIGRIFSGFSGVGKSTLATIWNKQGSQIINDDRLILRVMGNGDVMMYNTPMPYSDSSKATSLNYIYLPFHSKENSFKALSGAQRLAKTLAFCIQHGYNEKAILHHIHVMERIINKCPVASLGVYPDPEICGFIRSHEIQ